MISQKKLIRERNWDFLVILDACRYDYISIVYDQYLSGNLKKCKSKGGVTPEWANKTFRDLDMSDVHYVSSNPWINPTDKQPLDFDAREKFGKISPAFLEVWDDESNTVWPDKMREYSVKAISDCDLEKSIVHFIQPHSPWEEVDTQGSLGYMGFHAPKADGSTVPDILKKMARKFLRRRWEQEISKFLGLRKMGMDWCSELVNRIIKSQVKENVTPHLVMVLHQWEFSGVEETPTDSSSYAIEDNNRLLKEFLGKLEEDFNVEYQSISKLGEGIKP